MSHPISFGFFGIPYYWFLLYPLSIHCFSCSKKGSRSSTAHNTRCTHTPSSLLPDNPAQLCNTTIYSTYSCLICFSPFFVLGFLRLSKPSSSSSDIPSTYLLSGPIFVVFLVFQTSNWRSSTVSSRASDLIRVFHFASGLQLPSSSSPHIILHWLKFRTFPHIACQECNLYHTRNTPLISPNSKS
jgi:hypothetical protein